MALTFCRELVMKDFATDSDDTKLRQCAHLMVQSLASNLAMVTCKDPLRLTVMNQLRSTFINKWGEPQVRLLQTLVTDAVANVSLVCISDMKACALISTRADCERMQACTNCDRGGAKHWEWQQAHMHKMMSRESGPPGFVVYHFALHVAHKNVLQAPICRCACKPPLSRTVWAKRLCNKRVR